MKKLAEIVSEIENELNKDDKVAQDLSLKNTLPTISTTLGMALLKTASLLKDTKQDLSYNDITKFIQRVKNV